MRAAMTAALLVSHPFIFRPLLPNSKVNSSLTLYIKEYLYHPDEHPDYLKPVDMVWKEVNLAHCHLEEMAFWVMRLILSSVYQMPLGEYEKTY